MTHRLRWFAAGVSVGLLASRRIARSSTGTMIGDAAESVASRVRQVVDDVVGDTRNEMQRRETRLRELLAAPDERTTGAAGRRR